MPHNSYDMAQYPHTLPTRDVPPQTKDVPPVQGNPFIPKENTFHPPPPPLSTENPFAPNQAPGYQQPVPDYGPQPGWGGYPAPYSAYASPQRPQTAGYFQPSPFAPPSPYSQQPTYQDVTAGYYGEYPPEPPQPRSEPAYEPTVPRPTPARSIRQKSRASHQRSETERLQKQIDELQRRDQEREMEETARKAQEKARDIDILTEQVRRRLHVGRPSSMRRETPHETEIQSEPDRQPSARPGFDHRRYSTPARSAYNDGSSWGGPDRGGHKDAAQREMDNMREAKAQEERRRSPNRRPPPPSRQSDSYKDRVESDRRSMYSSMTDTESLQRAFAAGMEVALMMGGGSHASGSQYPASHHPGFEYAAANGPSGIRYEESQFRGGFGQYAPSGRGSSQPAPPMTEKELLGRPTRRGTRSGRQSGSARDPEAEVVEDPGPRRQPVPAMSGANVGVTRPPVEPRSKTHPGGRGPTYEEQVRMHPAVRMPAVRPDPSEWQTAWTHPAEEDEGDSWSGEELDGSQTYSSMRPGHHNPRGPSMPVAPTPPGRGHFR